MMFTPLAFVKSWFTWILLGFSILILMIWEITFYKHPEYFSEKTNAYIKCENCKEKLCNQKKKIYENWEKFLKSDRIKLESLKK